MKRKTVILATVLLIVMLIPSCSLLQEFGKTMTNIQRLQFKLENVSDFRMAGMNLSNKSIISDFSLTDGLKLTQAFATKRFPAYFTLNISARNPNDGTGGYPQTTSTITKLDWNLYIDDKLTVTGIIDKPIEIPGTGQSTNIPLGIELDLYKFFGEKGYESVINLALALGGVNKNAARIKLDIQPTVTTPLGPMVYPGRITVIDKEFRS